MTLLLALLATSASLAAPAMSHKDRALPGPPWHHKTQPRTIEGVGREFDESGPRRCEEEACGFDAME